MADDKTTKTPEQPVTDSGPGKETPPTPPKEPEKVSVSPEPEKKTEPEVKNPQVSVYNFTEIMKEKKAEERAAAPGGEKPDPAKAEKPEKQPEAPKKAAEKPKEPEQPKRRGRPPKAFKKMLQRLLICKRKCVGARFLMIFIKSLANQSLRG